MSKFNQVKEKPVVINHMGEKAIQESYEQELVGIATTSFVEDDYYRKSSEMQERLRMLISKVSPLFVAQLAIYARTVFGMRSITHIIAAELANPLSGLNWAKFFYEKIIRRPDDMLEIAAYFKSVTGKGLTNAMKKGFAAAIGNLDEYSMAKYKGKTKEVKMVDIVNLVHPKPTQKNALALSKLVKNELASIDTWEAELSKAGQNGKDANETMSLKSDAWSRLLKEGKLGYFALLRNLRNIYTQAPSNMIDEVIKQLTDKNKIKNSLVLPFRFLSAYAELEKLLPSVTPKGIKFEEDTTTGLGKILKAIDDAMVLSVENLPILNGRTAILSDNSASMTGRGVGFGRFSVTSTSDIANLFSVLYWLKASNTYVGLFGDRMIAPTLDRTKGIMHNFKLIDAEKEKCGGSTENGIYDFFEEAIRNKTVIDTIVVFSDCQIGDGCVWYGSSNGRSSGRFMNLFSEYKKISPNVRVYTVNLKGYGTTVFDGSTIKISGWSDKIFDVMKMTEIDKNALINEIKKIKI